MALNNDRMSLLSDPQDAGQMVNRAAGVSPPTMPFAMITDCAFTALSMAQHFAGSLSSITMKEEFGSISHFRTTAKRNRNRTVRAIGRRLTRSSKFGVRFSAESSLLAVKCTISTSLGLSQLPKTVRGLATLKSLYCSSLLAATVRWFEKNRRYLVSVAIARIFSA
jgi:hypothetical protein